MPWNADLLAQLLDAPAPAPGLGLARDRWSGPARSPRRGAGGAFRELRDWRAGDPVRRVDWRASARTGRWLLRETDQEARLRAAVILAEHSGLDYPLAADGRPGPNKRALLRSLALAAGLRWLRHGHALAWSVGGERLLPARGGRAAETAWREAVRSPVAWWPEAWPAGLGVDALWLLDDWLDEAAPERLHGLGMLTARGIEVRAVQILHPDERDFAFSGPWRFEALAGTEEPIDAQAGLLAEGYRSAFAAHAAALRDAAAGAGVLWFEQVGVPDIESALAMLLTGGGAWR